MKSKIKFLTQFGEIPNEKGFKRRMRIHQGMISIMSIKIWDYEIV